MTKILAVVVTYYPDEELLTKNIQAFVNDSVLGRNYMSAESFAINSMLWKRYSRRFFDESEDSVVRPLKVGDYMNVLNLNEYRGQYLYVDFWASWCEPCLKQMPNIKMAAQLFPDDLKVVLVGMDKTSKQWWAAVKEYDLRSHQQDEHPYEIQNLRAYNDKTHQMRPEVKRLDIKTIPHNYLVDRSGRIIAKNISGSLLIDRMKLAGGEPDADLRTRMLASADTAFTRGEGLPCPRSQACFVLSKAIPATLTLTALTGTPVMSCTDLEIASWISRDTFVTE